MLKLALVLALSAGLGTAPAFADSKGTDSIGRGCTLDPFNHTERCIDFDHCTTDKQGNRTCPVVVVSRKTAAF